MSDEQFPGKLPSPGRHPSSGSDSRSGSVTSASGQKKRSLSSTPNTATILERFHERASSASSTDVEALQRSLSGTFHRSPTIEEHVVLGSDVVDKEGLAPDAVAAPVLEESDKEDALKVSTPHPTGIWNGPTIRKVWNRVNLAGRLWRRGRARLDPPVEQLVRQVEEYFPYRAHLTVLIFDFGEGRAERKEVPLGDIEKEMFVKPSWSVVRWIHAPLGIGLYHSSVEDIFLNGLGRVKDKVRGPGRVFPQKRPFKRGGRAGWPFLETEIVNVRNYQDTLQMREAARILKHNKQVQHILNQRIFKDDRNKYLANDVIWRADYLGLEVSWWECCKSDLSWLLTDGALNMKSPAAVSRETNLNLKKQSLQKHPAYEDGYVVRDSFRLFHRGDGIMLTLCPANGLDYLTRDVAKAIRENGRVSSRHGPQHSAVEAVFEDLKLQGVSAWDQKAVEWLMVYIVTEIASTPHSIRLGYVAPSVLDSYDAVIHGLIERKFEPWKRKQTVSLVQSYLEAIDELGKLSQIYGDKLDFLKRLKEDCVEMELIDQDDTIGPRDYFDLSMTMSGRVEFAITAVRDLSMQCDRLLQELTTSLDELFKLRSIEQNDRSITADDQGKAVFIFTAVTIIFLPLSFMTSYFGMNVRGITESTYNQTDFWTVCAPFTVGIVSVVALYTYRARIRDGLRAPMLSRL